MCDVDHIIYFLSSCVCAFISDREGGGGGVFYIIQCQAICKAPRKVWEEEGGEDEGETEEDDVVDEKLEGGGIRKTYKY